MAKIKATALAKELGVDAESVIALAREKAPEGCSGPRHLTWMTPEAVEKVRMALVAPLAVPTKLVAKVLRMARNPHWAYCRILGIAGAVPVAIPKRHQAKCLGKIIPVEAVSDGSGETTYRYDLNPR